MRRAILLVSLVLLGCGDTKERLAGVDTTLPNGTVALATQDAMTDDVMVTDMNTTDGLDTMTDNMTALSAGMMSDYSMHDYTPTYMDREVEAARLEGQADRLEAQADSMMDPSSSIPTDPFATNVEN